MPDSKALQDWRGKRSDALDELFAAHAKLGGSGPGRRYATEQLNHALVGALAAQFQGFCRDLHEESSLALSGAVPKFAALVFNLLKAGRQLDRGNAQEGSLGSDFGRFGLSLWSEVQKKSPKLSEKRRESLRQLNAWRNALMHNDFNFSADELKKIGKSKPQLKFVKQWRTACDRLAHRFDEVLKLHLEKLTGTPPW